MTDPRYNHRVISPSWYNLRCSSTVTTLPHLHAAIYYTSTVIQYQRRAHTPLRYIRRVVLRISLVYPLHTLNCRLQTAVLLPPSMATHDPARVRLCYAMPTDR